MKIPLIILILLMSSCSKRQPYLGTTYVYKNKYAIETIFHVITIDNDNYFTYLLYTKSGILNEVVEGKYEKSGDSLILNVTKPIEFSIQKSSIKYSDHGSPDSIYFKVFELPPKVLKVNSTRYNKISKSLINNCENDTCPTSYFFETKEYGSASDGTIRELKKDNKQVKLDTLEFFDPNDNLIDKRLPIIWGEGNCIKIFLALRPKYDLINIPTKFVIKRNLLIAEFDNDHREYKLLYKNGVDLNKK